VKLIFEYLFQRSSIVMLLLVICVLPIRAQFIDRVNEPVPPLSTNEAVREYQFSLSPVEKEDRTNTDLNITDQANKPITGKKSGLLAAGLSLILPGLGEYYVGDQIWRGMIATAIEGGLWYGRYVYNKRGDDSLIAFHAWADTLWSVKRYTDSINDILALSGSSFRIRDTNNFNQINQGEDTLNYLGFQDFTHNLPPKGSQQYYELISKYDQFTPGWKDAQNHSLTSSADAERHAYMRANMNLQYDIADYFLWGMLINRVLSAIDAALLAKDHNSAIRLEGDLISKTLPGGFVAYIPTAKLHWTF
jgi:hypothetical protein